MDNKLRKLRGDKSLETVAKDLGITSQCLSNYETGKRSPRDEMKIALAKYYKRSVSYIFFSTDTNESLVK